MGQEKHPFLLVDKIIDLVPGERVTGLKNVTTNEPFFRGHFPGRAVMPGVLIIESMAQTGAILLLDALEEPEKKLALFISMDKVRFRKQVLPGDQLRMEIELVRQRSNSCKMKGKAFVEDEVVCEAELMCAIVDKENSI